MSDRHVVAALQRSVADLELRLREVVRERDEAYADRRKARQERDLARSAWEGAEDSLVAEREHSARLSRECQERHDELRAEVERLERLFQQTHGVHHSWVDARHKVAAAQREACAEALKLSNTALAYYQAAEIVRATPLVTEGKP